MYMSPAKRLPPPKRPQLRRTFIRQWRKHRGLTLEKVADRVTTSGVDITHASLSRVERGIQPYNQPLLEAIAEALQTDVASLLMRDPTDSEALWSIWDQAKPGERLIFLELAKTLMKSAS